MLIYFLCSCLFIINHILSQMYVKLVSWCSLLYCAYTRYFKKNHVLYETVLISIIKHSHMSITNANLYLSCILKRKKDNYGKRVHKTCWSVISMLRLFLEPFWQCGIVLCSVIVCSLYVWYRMNLQMK